MTPRPDTSWLANVTRSQMRGLDIDRKPQRTVIEHRVMMTIKGTEVDSSCVYCGTKQTCEATAERLNRTAAKDVRWIVLPCIA